MTYNKILSKKSKREKVSSLQIPFGKSIHHTSTFLFPFQLTRKQQLLNSTAPENKSIKAQSRGKFEEEEGLRSNVVRDSYEVGVWKVIQQSWDFSKTLVSFAVDSGSRMKFWKDRWCNEESPNVGLFHPCLSYLF